MDRSWMYGDHTCLQYVNGVIEFLKCAEDDRKKYKKDKIVCPCSVCNNTVGYDNPAEVRNHLFKNGFKSGYTCWFWHGEEIVSGMSSGGNSGGGNGGGHINKNKVGNDNDGQEGNIDMNVEYDRLDEMLRDVQDDFIDRPHEFEKLFADSEKPLYPGCVKYNKLSAVFKLLSLKAKSAWSDRSFTALLELLVDMLPDHNELPNSTYKAKKMLCPLGMEIEKIDACPNDCILYRNEYIDLYVCPKCGVSRYQRKNRNTNCEGNKGPPAKVLWYLPVIPRFKRLFANADDAAKLLWHAEGRKKDGKLRHPADSPEWCNFNRRFRDFGDEDRNLRLGLCTDGMNPHGDMSSRHSTWPVLLVIYNLPPWLSMKRKYMMMSLLISGPKQPGNDIDVYLAPLVDDLRRLWEEGVEVFDANRRENFNLRAMLFCTINDLPAFGNLSGYTIKGGKACPVCEDATCSLYLNNCKKNVYMDHRVFLPKNHRYRKNKEDFNGKTENRVARLPLSGEEVFERVKDISIQFGKTIKQTKKSIWKKRSIFWDLPYWKYLEVRHCIDFMHVEKNVCENIIGTLLNIPGKTKDSVNARKDMMDLGIRPELAPTEEMGKRPFLPAACYTLSKKEKQIFCECLRGVKVPSGYSSNIRRFVSMKDLKLVGMKSHDCHIMMQQLLPIAIRGILPENVRRVIQQLCFFFNAIFSKVIDPDELDRLQANVVVTICQLEMYFPPSFFDVMVHLVIHLVRQIKQLGPIFLHNMYPFERFMGVLKGYVRNRFRPEGSIVEGYVAEEVIEFCTDYLAKVEPIGIPTSRHEGRLDGKGIVGRKPIDPTAEDLAKAHLLVLHHLAVVQPYFNEHMEILRAENPLKGEMWLVSEHNRCFPNWFKSKVMKRLTHAPEMIEETVKWLAYGHASRVTSYQGYEINGYTFYTKCQDDKSTMQNSGVSQVAVSTDNRVDTYYGVIEEIWELDYTKFQMCVFRCKWVDNTRGVSIDKLGFSRVDFSRVGSRNDPFILASQAKQVFYITDPADAKWSVVLQGKRRIVGIGEVVDEDEYDHCDETPPFSTEMPILDPQEHNTGTNYLRSDHQEGEYVE